MAAELAVGGVAASLLRGVGTEMATAPVRCLRPGSVVSSCVVASVVAAAAAVTWRASAPAPEW